ncbi:class I SAM-dependent methyltransferase [Oscillatoria sp. CS-180]|uniref:class I SAM-dependent methyltransferase n=1 Tax=Oscillatoria sp. CS-180 TaxID=3021720 RepID=UPI00232CB2FA|nr:class I SAM-dependent methyltransferase [Oscillatoria sp. CS-180]MDB9529403.1 class I SAM-dependent methyltransferase [Oscillatoria sp. CS-180]
MTFKDYFSGHAADYSHYRPRYPSELFDGLSQLCQAHDSVWDCATGNGQAAIALTSHFRQVMATDGSAAQLSQAPAHPQVSYQVAVAEDSGLAENQFDLVTVAQAVHWFDREAFYREVRRVLKPGGVLAIWCYGKPMLANPASDKLLEQYYGHTLDDFWTPERRLVEDGYRTLAFPFSEIPASPYTMQVSWTLPQLMGYLYTWSATQRYIAAHQINPLEKLAEQLADAMATAQERDRFSVSWPINLRVGRL